MRLGGSLPRYADTASSEEPENSWVATEIFMRPAALVRLCERAVPTSWQGGDAPIGRPAHGRDLPVAEVELSRESEGVMLHAR
jgi:hypothetical protein